MQKIITSIVFAVAVSISSFAVGSAESKDRHVAHIIGRHTHEVKKQVVEMSARRSSFQASSRREQFVHDHVHVRLHALRVKQDHPVQSLSVFAAWSNVARCEEGGWVGYSGAAYPDSLGIGAAAWNEFATSHDESPSAQIAVARRVIRSLIGQIVQGVRVTSVDFVPDWNGVCRGSW